MAHLDLFAQRKHSTVTLADQKTYKLPNEYTVDEVERILELREEIEALEAQEVNGDGKAQRETHTSLIFAQLGIMFGHYQPDVTPEYLKTIISHNEALETIGFFRKYRHTALKELSKESAQKRTDSKKKSTLSATKELRELRRMIVYMVTCGFSLYELRKLYIDELHEFYFELVHILEESGKVTKGAYDKVRSRGSAPLSASDTVASLRSQMFKSISNKPKAKK